MMFFRSSHCKWWMFDGQVSWPRVRAVVPWICRRKGLLTRYPTTGVLGKGWYPCKHTQPYKDAVTNNKVLLARKSGFPQVDASFSGSEDDEKLYETPSHWCGKIPSFGSIPQRGLLKSSVDPFVTVSALLSLLSPAFPCSGNQKSLDAVKAELHRSGWTVLGPLAWLLEEN